MEINEIKQKPKKLNELLKERAEIEKAEERLKTNPNNEGVFFEPRIEETPKKDKKTIVIVDCDFVKRSENTNTIHKLNHRATYLKNKVSEEVDIWFLYSKNLYELFLKGVRGKIDYLILGNYEKIETIEKIIKDFKNRGFDENKIIYQRLRDFREYVEDLLRRTKIFP